MINVRKSERVPAVLETKGVDKRNEYCVEYTNNSAPYMAGRQTFDIDQNIYGHNTVKSKLLNLQSQKCCYCESKVGKGKQSSGDIEHFRPKKYSQQKEKGKKEFPGYYWLAYEWDNLYFSCEICNRVHKRNLFPLADPDTRSRNRGSPR